MWCQKKGAHWYAVKTLNAEIRQLGYKKIVFKSDQESPIVALKEAVWREIGNEVTMERVEEGKEKRKERKGLRKSRIWLWRSPP